MTIVILLLLYLALPFAELAAIIVLAVLNGQKKRRIDELNRELAAIREMDFRCLWRSSRCVYIYDALNENICLYIKNEYGNICQNYLI